MKRVNEYRDHEEIDLPIENMSLAVKIFTILEIPRQSSRSPPMSRIFETYHSKSMLFPCLCCALNQKFEHQSTAVPS
jgi:hypothetical protein